MSDWSEWFTLDLGKVDWKRTALLVLLILATFAALWQWAMPEVREVQSTVFKRVPEIKRVETVRRVLVPCPKQGVVALDPQEVSDRLGSGWQDWVEEKGKEETQETKVTPRTAGTSDLVEKAPAADLMEELAAEPAGEQAGEVVVTATGTLPETPNGYDTLALFNTGTGVTYLAAEEKTAPWFQFRNNYGAGIRYGVGVGGAVPTYTGTLYGFWEFLRVKDVYFTGYGEVNTDGYGKGQFDMQWRKR